MKIWECGKCGQLFGQGRVKIINHHGKAHPGNDQVTMIEHEVLTAGDANRIKEDINGLRRNIKDIFATLNGKPAMTATETKVLEPERLRAENVRLKGLLKEWAKLFPVTAFPDLKDFVKLPQLILDTKAELGE